MTITTDQLAQDLKLDLGSELYKEFEAKKMAIYSYVTHVFAGNDPQETPDGESWYNHLASPVAERIVNAYRATKGIPPNPFHPANRRPFKAFDLLRTYEDNGSSWMPSGMLRSYLDNAMVESTFGKRKLDRAGWVLEKKYEGAKPFYRLVRT